MAPPAGTIRPARYLALFLLVVVVLYALVFFTGDGKPAPRLGIDLKGGTSVTLTATSPDGSEPTREQLDQARAIIDERVNGLGVSGAEVVLDGRNILITVPGAKGEQAKTLGQTAKLGFRRVMGPPLNPAAAKQDDGKAKGDKGEGDKGKGDKTEEGDKGGSGGGGAVGGAPTQTDPNQDEDTAKAIREARAIRQSPDLLKPGAEQTKALEAALKTISCTKGATDALRGHDDPKKPLVACQQQRKQTGEPTAYLLGPVVMDGTMVNDAGSGPNSDGVGFQVNVDFTGEGNKAWSKLTAALAKEGTPDQPAQVAFVLDSEVVSAPTVKEHLVGNTRITGDFTQGEAQELAQILKYGSLPLTFTSSDATTVSATLGLSSLKAGLIAGAFGLALVMLYSLFYYRLLGVLLAASIVLTAGLVFPLLVLLGRSIGYTLDLAGVAGLIISIGVTADSFIVYFERIKDEIRDGRSVRSAIPRAWVRARRTILSADAVVLLAAITLYLLSVGQVKGFAFTVGLSTMLDLLVVFLVTHPLLVLAGGWHILNNRALSGLGLVQDLGSVAQSKRRARPATAKGV